MTTKESGTAFSSMHSDAVSIWMTESVKPTVAVRLEENKGVKTAENQRYDPIAGCVMTVFQMQILSRQEYGGDGGRGVGGGEELEEVK